MNDLKACWWLIAKVIPYARNSRKIPEHAFDKQLDLITTTRTQELTRWRT